MRPFLLLAILLPAAAPAADAVRTVGLGTFERLRVEGPFEVAVTEGPAAARITGDRAAVDRVRLLQDGATLVVRAEGGAAPARIALSSPALGTVVSQRGARIALGTLRARRIDLTVAGGGAISLAGANADEVGGAVVGAGSMTLVGRTAHARLLASGPATIDADALEAGELDLIADATGDTRARARYVARISNRGVGRVSVAGNPKCILRPAEANVACGASRRPGD